MLPTSSTVLKNAECHDMLTCEGESVNRLKWLLDNLEDVRGRKALTSQQKPVKEVAPEQYIHMRDPT